MRRADEIAPALFWYCSTEVAVIVGPSVRAIEVEPSSGAVPIVRRQSGGAAVLLDPGVLGLDILLPPRHPLLSGDVVEDYRWLGDAWRQALVDLGIDARLIPIQEAHEHAQKWSHSPEIKLACFGLYSPFEVAVGPRKIVGLAQIRRMGGLLFASAIHVDSRPSDLAAVLRLSPESRKHLASHLDNSAAGLNDISSRRIGAVEVVSAFEEVLCRRYKIFFDDMYPIALSDAVEPVPATPSD